MENIKISVAKDFSRTTGARYLKDGPYSGQAFYEDLLRAKFEEAVRLGVELHVDLDGVAGYATSFLHESFGKLASEFSAEQVKRHLRLKCNDEPLIIRRIQRYIQEAA